MNTTVEINGKQYNALTGELINKPVVNSAKNRSPNPAHKTKSHGSGTTFDVVRPKHTTQIVSSTHTSRQSKTPKTTRHIATHASHQPKKSGTLARKAVSKPKSTANVIHSQSISLAQSSALPLTHQSQKPSIISPPKQRVERADKVAMSKSISKFGASINSQPRYSEDLRVKQEPPQTSIPDTPPAINLIKHSDNQATVFAHRIAQSTNHRAEKVKKQRSSGFAKAFAKGSATASVGAGALAIILLAGFFAYQRIPVFAMKVAAQRSGVNGHLPSDVPSGFSINGPILYSKGEIVLKYKSNTDDRSFSLSQKQTNLNSESLLTTQLASHSTEFTTHHSQGLTVFIGDNGSATWIYKGVLYNLSELSSLSTDQIITIANSI